MKKVLGYSVVLALAGLLTGCVVPTAPVGGIAGSLYTDVSGPLFVTSHTGSSKVGEATAQGILGFAQGDTSIKAAAASAGITKIHNVDYHTTSILWVWTKTTVTVYGE